tara:strand:- start:45 stop:296 length:252 start_codon:yes stop_codon:yes gene_type:complete
MNKFRLIIWPALEHNQNRADRFYKEFEFESSEKMVVAMNTAADLLLFIQTEPEVMKDYSNAFAMFEFIDGAWEEYESSSEDLS